MSQQDSATRAAFEAIIRLIRQQLQAPQRMRLFDAMPEEYNDVLNKVFDDMKKSGGFKPADGEVEKIPGHSLDTVLNAAQAFTAAHAVCCTRGGAPIAWAKSIDFSEATPKIVIQWVDNPRTEISSSQMRARLEYEMMFVVEQYGVLLLYLEPQKSES